MFNLLSSRPNHADWKPVANFSESDEKRAYQIAAEKLGVKIKIGYTVPNTPAGADYCARWLGMKGVYIKRSQAEKERELVTGYFNELRAMSE